MSHKLCLQGRVASYYYDVSSKGNYNERLVPQSPPRAQDVRHLQPQMVPLIDENWPQPPGLPLRRCVSCQEYTAFLRSSRIFLACWLGLLVEGIQKHHFQNEAKSALRKR